MNPQIEQRGETAHWQRTHRAGAWVPGHAPDGRDARWGNTQWYGLGALILILAAFHLFTLESGHPWGDDWALYVLHARNLVEGRPYADTGFIYNPAAPFYSPGVYPPGLPVLLAPIYVAAGLDLMLMKAVPLAAFIGALVLIALLARTMLPPHFTLALVAVVGFQPYLGLYKNLILPDLPFLFFTLLALLLVRRLDRPDARAWEGLAAGLAIYTAIAMRTVGITLIGALVLWLIVRRKRPRVPEIVALAIALLLFGVQSQLMPAGSGYAGQIADATIQYGGRPPLKPLFDIAEWVRLSTFLWLGLPVALRVAVSAAVGLLATAGFLLHVRRFSVVEAFVVCYAGAILIYGAIGLRYLIPIIPLFACYALFTLSRVQRSYRRAGAVLAVSLAGLVAIGYARTLHRSAAEPRSNAVSPSALDLYDYAQRCTPAEARFAFARARAFALFAERPTIYPARSHRPDRYLYALDYAGAEYVVVERADPQHQLPDDQEALFVQLYTNEDFVVYRYLGAGALEDGSVPDGCPVGSGG
jgi:4-amino-4-deoxy-L-arabinose transferase-like glycosyltransferase